MTEIALVTWTLDWHARRLLSAFAAMDVTCRPVRLEASSFQVAKGQRPAIRLPGFESRLPDAVLVRTMGGGSFEQVTKRLGVLHALEASGVRVLNPPRAIERCVDKSMTTFLLAHAGLPTPATWVMESREEAAALVTDMAAKGRALVLKPLFGSQGKGLRKVETAGDLPEVHLCGGVYYLQEFIQSTGRDWRDWRVMVVGGRAVAGMQRVGNHWITNVKQGASCVATSISGGLSELAVVAAQAVGASHAGVDIIARPDSTLAVLEVNSMPAWKGLQSVCNIDIAWTLAAWATNAAANQRGMSQHVSA